MSDSVPRAATGRVGPLTGDAVKSLRARVREVLNGHPGVRVAFLYGSAAEGRPFRDLDIGLVVDRGRVPQDHDLDVGLRLSDELTPSLGTAADARVINDAPMALRYAVSRGVVLSARSGEDAADFKERTWIEYCDFQPVAGAYLREAG